MMATRSAFCEVGMETFECANPRISSFRALYCKSLHVKYNDSDNTGSDIDMNDDIDIFINCSWVDTRWQWYSTHLHINNT
jgi:hypothetical protein